MDQDYMDIFFQLKHVVKSNKINSVKKYFLAYKTS